jgi:hypothetical protein
MMSDNAMAQLAACLPSLALSAPGPGVNYPPDNHNTSKFAGFAGIARDGIFLR